MSCLKRTVPILMILPALFLFAVPACKKAPPPKPLPPVAVTPKKAPEAAAPADTSVKAPQFGYTVTERNPFGSLLRVKKTVEDGTPEEQLTPLQRVPVNDMRVESIIVSRSRSVAHVITPDGKAHIVSVGTPMGRHKGKVISIKPDEIIVEEQFEDYLGREFKQESVLRLREKEGENQ